MSGKISHSLGKNAEKITISPKKKKKKKKRKPTLSGEPPPTS
jgi:hypothetical protein